MNIAESGEMYLETILILSKKNAHVRSIDVADYMNFSKPSVSRAMGKLRSDGFVETNENGWLTLTDSGKEIAEKIYERHNLLTTLLINLGVPEEDAVRDACKIEHVLSDSSFSAIKKHVSLHNKL